MPTGQPVQGKSIEIIPVPGSSKSVFAPRVDLEDAAPWLLKAREVMNGKLQEPFTGTIYGFYDLGEKLKTDDMLYRFIYVDADKALASHQNYTQEIAKIAFKQKRILLLPDGALTKVPFEMLIVQKSESEDPKYLLDMPAATVYSPAASVWYNLTLRKKNPIDSILTMGDAIYSKENVQNATRGVQSQLEYINHSGFTPLPNTRVESNTLKERSTIQNFTCSQFLSGEATEEYLKNNVGGKSIVHIACHGLADNSYGGAFAALVLSPGSSTNNPENDGVLTLSEMFGLDLKSCTLAVLSACETNLGANQKGEGTWSICRGFQTSGATNVVTTNWNVSDLAGAILVTQFVNDVMTDPNDDQMAEKLQKSRRLLRSGKLNRNWAHPFFWAPFILMGP